jgi:GNAT superfamily N-acetyltransferase
VTTPKPVRSVLLDPIRHHTAAFDCGNASLDHWITHFADHSRRSRTANTYVFAEQGRVIAYFALTPHATGRDEVEHRVGRGSPSLIPSYLVAKFAVTRSHQGRGVGSALLLDSLTRVVAVSDVAPGRLVSVDAVDEAAARFYEHFGFVRGRGSSLTLHMKMSTAIRLIAG